MNKMTKGAIATGVGVALLLGGGGTLAVWNVGQETGAGVVASGDLDMVAQPGKWLAGDADADISTYKEIDIEGYGVVPGEKLVYTQVLDVSLEGDLMEAELTIVDTANLLSSFESRNIDWQGITLKNLNGDVLPATLAAGSHTVAATASFEFRESTGDGVGIDGREDYDATFDFSQVGYKLEQIAPNSVAG